MGRGFESRSHILWSIGSPRLKEVVCNCGRSRISPVRKTGFQGWVLTVSFGEAQSKVSESLNFNKSVVCQKNISQLPRKDRSLNFDHTFIVNCVNRRGGWMLLLFFHQLMCHSFPNLCNL